MAGKKGIVKGIVTVLVVAGLAGGGYMYYNGRETAAGQDNRSAVRTSPVIRGNISSMVSGSGSVATSREQALAAPGASTLLEIHVEDGDTVAKGDVLFVLDCPEVVSSQQAVSKYEYELAEYYASKSDLQKVADKEYLVTSLSARVGDKMSRNGAIMSLLDISTMTLQVPAEEGVAWAAGDNMQITLLEYGNMVSGTLIGEPTFSRSNGMDYLSFTLLLEKGQRIGNETYGQAHNRSAGNQSAVILRPNAETQIKSPADGYLEVLNAVEGDIIPAGTLMYRIDSTNLDSQISNANSEMQVAMANLKQKKTTLTADFDGIYYAAADSSGPKNTFLQTGDSLRSNDSLGKVVDSDRMQIVFNVDELDIAKVEIGQEVRVVADALPDKVYTGRVARIAQEGAGSGNVAYYWVLIEVTEWDGLKVGMTSSLEIVVESASNTLMVPINAVRTMRGVKYVILAEDQSGTGTGTFTVQGGEPSQGGQPVRGGQPMQGGQGGEPTIGYQPVQGSQSSEPGQMTRQRPDGAMPGGAEGARPEGAVGAVGADGADGARQRPEGAPEGAQGVRLDGVALGSADMANAAEPGAADTAGQTAQPGQGGQGDVGGIGSVNGEPVEGGPVRFEGQPVQGGQPIQGGEAMTPGEGAQPGAQQIRMSDGSGGSMNLALPERAVVVQTGIINDTFVEILYGLEEGQIVELAGSAATGAGNFMGNTMFVGPGPMGGGGGVVTMSTAPVSR